MGNLFIGSLVIGNLLLAILAFAGGLKKHAPLIRANMRIWLKIRVFLVMVKFVSIYVERSKKFSKSKFFAPTLLRIWSIFHFPSAPSTALGTSLLRVNSKLSVNWPQAAAKKREIWFFSRIFTFFYKKERTFGPKNDDFDVFFQKCRFSDIVKPSGKILE